MSNMYEVEVGDKLLLIETGRLATQAQGSITVALGETVVLVTACVTPEPREGIDFFPLTLDFEERMYAVGKIPGSFMRREGRPSTEAVLAGRMTDRALRPLFPKGFRNDVQIIITVLSADQENDPDVLATIGASAALSISEIPFDGPVSRHARRLRQRRVRHLPDLRRAGRERAGPDHQLDPRQGDHGRGRRQGRHRRHLRCRGRRSRTRTTRRSSPSRTRWSRSWPSRRWAYSGKDADAAAVEAVAEASSRPVSTKCSPPSPKSAPAARRSIKDDLTAHLGADYSKEQLNDALEVVVKKMVRGRILKDGKRADGRDLDELRQISCDVGILPRTHGTGLFQRGETQVLSIVTLGSMSAAQKLDTLAPGRQEALHAPLQLPALLGR